jgi:hypothetical protein
MKSQRFKEVWPCAIQCETPAQFAEVSKILEDNGIFRVYDQRGIEANSFYSFVRALDDLGILYRYSVTYQDDLTCYAYEEFVAALAGCEADGTPIEETKPILETFSDFARKELFEYGLEPENITILRAILRKWEIKNRKR